MQNLLINDSPFNADVIFVHFDELDAAGHAFGFSSDVLEYSSTLNTLDTYVENLFSTINKNVFLEDWLIMVVSVMVRNRSWRCTEPLHQPNYIFCSASQFGF